MSQEINFPTSMNLRNVKETAEPTMRGDFMVFDSQNQTYGARSTIRIPIENAANTWLHGNDSFLSFRVKINGSSTGGAIALDGTCYSIFKNARLTQASNILCEQNECGRLWNSLFDLQVAGSERASKEITHGIQQNDFGSIANGLYGATISDGKYLYFSIALPMSIVGTLSEKSFPLSTLKTNLMLELDVEDLNKMVTTRESNETILGVHTASTALALTSVEIDQVSYHAKVSNVGVYNSILMNALGPSVVIPGIEYMADNKEVPAGTTSMSTNFAFPVKSAKNVLFWFTNSETAQGVETGGKLNSAITQRCVGGNLKNYYLSIAGVSFPSLPIDASGGTNLTLNSRTGINGSLPMQQLLRCFNLNSSSNGGGVLGHTIYNSEVSTWAGDASTKHAILGIDLDRGSNDGDKYFQGVNIQNSTISLRANWNTGPTESQTLYAYVMHDVGFVIQDGVCVASR
jgi:hypothetical protein